MAGERKIALVALLIISMLIASSAPATAQNENPCFKVCFDRCANGKNNDACSSMCSEGCTVPKVLPDGRDPTAILTGK